MKMPYGHCDFCSLWVNSFSYDPRIRVQESGYKIVTAQFNNRLPMCCRWEGGVGNGRISTINKG